ncbi:Thioredoxin domain-containing protein 2 [Podochytrium sp. JEL0797]|nr:Thioredoxin domain-containing protein 2 [Podochytrium sp. JEL0797]
MGVITITSEAEFNKHIGGSKLAVVDFTATWCGPSLAAKFPNCLFLKCDVDANKNIASTHGVRAMPTFQLFKSGRKIAEVVGADIGKVESLVNTHAAGSSGFPTSGGRTLGGSGSSSAAPTGTGSGLGAAVSNTGFLNILGNLTVMQQQILFLGGLLAVFYALAK